MEKKQFSLILEFLSVAFLLLSLYPLLKFGSLENISVPQHFNFKGEVDIWSTREILIYLTLVGVVMYALLTLCQKHTKLVHLSFLSKGLSPEDRTLMAKSLALRLKFWLMVMAAFLSVSSYRIAIGQEQKLDMAILCAIILCMIAHLVFVSLSVRRKANVGA